MISFGKKLNLIYSLIVSIFALNIADVYGCGNPNYLDMEQDAQGNSYAVWNSAEATNANTMTAGAGVWNTDGVNTMRTTSTTFGTSPVWSSPVSMP